MFFDGQVCESWSCCCWTRSRCWATSCCSASSFSSSSVSSAFNCGPAFCASVATSNYRTAFTHRITCKLPFLLLNAAKRTRLGNNSALECGSLTFGANLQIASPFKFYSTKINEILSKNSPSRLLHEVQFWYQSKPKK